MRERYFTYFGILAVATAFLTIGITTSIHADWFSWTSNALSDLGALDATHNQIFNGGVILTGIFGIIFGFGLVGYFKNSISKIGSTVFTVGMIFLILVGAFPLETSTDVTVTLFTPHVVFALIFFGFAGLGIFLTGIGENREGNVLGFIIVLMVLVLIPVGLVSSINFSGLAIPEMAGFLVFSIFILIYSKKLGNE